MSQYDSRNEPKGTSLMPPLAQPIQDLLAGARALAEREVPESGGITIETHKVVSAAATLYEKIRYLVDYQEEHAIRRSAIERILKRRILIENRKIDAHSILAEIVDGGYVRAEDLTQDSLRLVDQSLAKFFRIRPHLKGSNSLERSILSFVAGDIESVLIPGEYDRDDATAKALYKTVRPRIVAPDLSTIDVDIQTRCACRRALLGEDDASLRYSLWIWYVPQWKGDGEGVEALIPQMPAIVAYIRKQVDDSTHWHIAQKIKNESVYFRIIREFVRRDPVGATSLFENSERLESETRAFLSQKYARENKKTRSSGLRAVWYLLFTKFILALVIELPYEAFILGGGVHFPLFVNILFHPALLFSLTYFAGSMGKENTDAIIRGMNSVLHGADTRKITIRSKKRLVKTFAVLYGLLTLGIFGSLLAVLQALDFNIVSMALFFAFFVLVSYFAFRIRYNASRWRVVYNSNLSLIISMFVLPVVSTGRWLGRKFSTVNMFVFIMDFVIETPFKRVLNFSNQFILYLREKAAEVR